MPNELIHINRLSKSDFEAIIAISNQQFGVAYIKLEQLVARQGQVEDVSVTASINHRLAGYALSKKIRPIDLYSIFHQAESSTLDFFENKNSILWIESIAVDSVAVGNGIGKKLIHTLVQNTKTEVDAALSLVWEHKNGNPLGTIFEHMGFQRLQYIANFWLADSLEKGYDCYYCGKPPCKCSAIIYGLK